MGIVDLSAIPVFFRLLNKTDYAKSFLNTKNFINFAGANPGVASKWKSRGGQRARTGSSAG